jgi:hypothetical protein
VTLVDLEKTIVLLLAKRAELCDQIIAIDTAVQALRGEHSNRQEPSAAVSDSAVSVERIEPPPDVTRLKPKRVLSDEHKQKLVAGRQQARLAKDVASGKARDSLAGVPALAAPVSQAPRLVKRGRTDGDAGPRRERTVEPEVDRRDQPREEVTH